MSEELASQLNAHAAEMERRKRANIERENVQRTHDAFICDRARPEYEKLRGLLEKKVEEIRSKTGNSFAFVVTGSYIQLGPVALRYNFDQPIVDHPDNELVLTLGVAPFKDVFGFSPTPERYELVATADGSNREIVWAGSPGEFSSAKLADFALRKLVDYYCRNVSK